MLPQMISYCYWILINKKTLHMARFKRYSSEVKKILIQFHYFGL